MKLHDMRSWPSRCNWSPRCNWSSRCAGGVQQRAYRDHARSPRRRAATLVAVLVCLGIVMAITATGMQTSLRARRQIKTHWQLEQTRLLFDAGIRRTWRLAAPSQPDYEGEVWVLDEAFEMYPYARVEIKPLGPEENSDLLSGRRGETTDRPERRFAIIATIRNQDTVPVQTRRSQIISLSPAGKAHRDAEPTETSSN